MLRVVCVDESEEKGCKDSHYQYLDLQSDIPIHIDDGLRVKRSYVLALDSDISPLTLCGRYGPCHRLCKPDIPLTHSAINNAAS